MTTLVAQNFTSFVFAQGDDIKTTSRIVAEKFGKRHDNVLATIDKILTQVSDIFGVLNFKESSYINEQNKEQRMFEITKDGFMILVMGFTGVPAMAIKETYINAFNLMVEKLRPKTYALRDLPPAYLTPAMKKHINRQVAFLAKTQIGTTHSALGKSIQDEFNVNKREFILASKYREVCAFLNCEPDTKALQGVLLEPVKVDYQVPAGMVLIAESDLTALEYQQGMTQIHDDKLLVDKKFHESLVRFQHGLLVGEQTFYPPAGIATLKIEDYEDLKFKATQFDKLKGFFEA